MRYLDGRQICNFCRRTAIMQSSDVKPLELQVKRFLASINMDLRHETIPVHLLSQDEMHEQRPVKAGGLAGLAYRTLDGEPVRYMRDVSILYGLPAEHFATILVHEYGHAWMWLNDYPELPRPVEEGICELLEYIWLSSLHTSIASYRMKGIETNKDKIYGDGFRSAYKLTKKHGLHKLLKYVKAHQRFPQ